MQLIHIKVGEGSLSYFALDANSKMAKVKEPQHQTAALF